MPTPSDNTGTHNQYDYIDTTRGIAILLVIFVHAGQLRPTFTETPAIIWWYGQMGVQLFFVASAFTLALSWDRRCNEEHQLKKYFIRRYFRIAPAYYLGILLYGLYNTLTLSLDKQHFLIPDSYHLTPVLANLLFVHGFLPTANNNVVPGGWSIGTEVAFYAVFPLLLPWLKKNAGNSITRHITVNLIVLTGSLILINFLSHTTSLPFYNNSFLYFNILNQIPVFVLGLSYYLLASNRAKSLPSLICTSLFFLLTLAPMLLWYRKDFLEQFTIIPFLSGLSFIFLMETLKNNKFLNHHLLRDFGKLSFSMYLIHFLIISVFSTNIVKWTYPIVGSDLSTYLGFGLTVLLSYLLAKATSSFIEVPFIKMGQRICHSLNTSKQESKLQY